MDTHFLDSLLAVVETGSYAAAARRQNMTPAAVSQRIKSLEVELGKPLFVRAGQKVTPTPACESILQRLRHIMDEVSLIHDNMNTPGPIGRLKLGAISTALIDYIPDILARFARDAPRATISIVPGTSAHLFEKLATAEIDAALLIRPPFKLPKSLQCISLESQPFAFVSAANDTRDISEIMATERALVYDTASWGGKMLQPWIWQNLGPDKILCELDALESIAIGVSHGLGYSVLPVWAGLTNIAAVQLRPIPQLSFKRELVILHRSISTNAISLIKG